MFRDAGVYGCVFEGIKYLKKVNGTIKLQGDFVYPSDLYKEHFSVFKDLLHKYGMKFYSGENRLRYMGDSLCCCGIDGLGWRENKANLNHYIYDKKNFVFTDNMNNEKTGVCFKSLNQSAIGRAVYHYPYSKFMDMYTRDFGAISQLLPDEKQIEILKKIKK